MSRKSNFENLLKNGKARIIIGATVIIVGAGIYLGLSGSHSEPTKTPQTVGVSNVNDAPDLNVTPGSSDSKSYNDLQRKSNEEKAAAAQKSGQSTLPVLVNNTTDNKNDAFADLNQSNVKPIKEDKPVIDTTPPAPVQAAPVQQQQQVVYVPQSQQQQPKVEDRTQQMQMVDKQMNNYLLQWGSHNSTQEYNMTGKRKEDPAGDNGGNSSNGLLTNVSSNTGTANASQSSSDKKGPAFVRAGTVVPGVMITAINSDNPGPVLAQIVTGPLKGARLIGQMRSSNTAVVVQFTQLSIPGAQQTFQINAYAVDQTTARTGMATDVDNHYFLRYGLGLAAAFVEGYGDAVSSAGSTTTTNAFGGTTTVLGDMTHKQIAESAMGKVGSKLGSELEKDTNRAPTVTVDSGTPLGLLFMSDF